MKTQAEMFEASFMRPSSYFELSAESQWATDKSLGILDWDGSGANGPMTPEEKARFAPVCIKTTCLSRLY